MRKMSSFERIEQPSSASEVKVKTTADHPRGPQFLIIKDVPSIQ